MAQQLENPTSTATVVSNKDIQCSAQINNSDENCGALLERVDPTIFTNCDCYDFCNGHLTACLLEGEQNFLEWCPPGGYKVAGCTDAQRLEHSPAEGESPQEETTPSLLPVPTEDDNNQAEEDLDSNNSNSDEGEDTTSSSQQPVDTGCKVQTNNSPDTCRALLEGGHHTRTVVCDCYNFCNDRLTGCLNFGEESWSPCEDRSVDGSPGQRVEGCHAGPKTDLASLFVDKLPPTRSSAGATAVTATAHRLLLVLLGSTILLPSIL